MEGKALLLNRPIRHSWDLENCWGVGEEGKMYALTFKRLCLAHSDFVRILRKDKTNWYVFSQCSIESW